MINQGATTAYFWLIILIVDVPIVLYNIYCFYKSSKKTEELSEYNVTGRAIIMREILSPLLYLNIIGTFINLIIILMVISI